MSLASSEGLLLRSIDKPRSSGFSKKMVWSIQIFLRSTHSSITNTITNNWHSNHHSFRLNSQDSFISYSYMAAVEDQNMFAQWPKKLQCFCYFFPPARANLFWYALLKHNLYSWFVFCVKFFQDLKCYNLELEFSGEILDIPFSILNWSEYIRWFYSFSRHQRRHKTQQTSSFCRYA